MDISEDESLFIVLVESLDTTPPSLVTDFRASDGEEGQCTLTWTNPSDSDLAEVVVKRTTDSYPNGHTDGITVYQDLNPSPNEYITYTDTDVESGVTYYYAVFSKDSAGNWNDQVQEGKNADTGIASGKHPPQAQIDIDPDTLNPKSKGKWITCYIELPDDYDVGNINVDSIRLEEQDELVVEHSDVQDGVLMVKFSRQDVIAYIESLELELPADVTLKVTGELTDGTPFEGSDTIRVIEKGKGKPAPAKPLVFEALAAYPQPCNPDAWIPYTLAKDVEVTITIYSSSGRIIRTLRLGYQKAGAYISKSRAVHWDGRNESGERVTSGLYFYTIKAGEFIATRKLVVLR